MPEIDTSGYDEHHLKQALSGQYERHGNPNVAECVIGCAFGYRAADGQITPGPVNEALARFGEHYPLLPKILQWEIADAYAARQDENILRIEQPWHAERLDTPEIIEQARVLMKERGWQVALLIAHPHHLPWVDYVAQQSGLTTIVPDGLEAIGFDPQSAQYWTRSREAWRREVLGRHQGGDPRTPRE